MECPQSLFQLVGLPSGVNRSSISFICFGFLSHNFVLRGKLPFMKWWLISRNVPALFLCSLFNRKKRDLKNIYILKFKGL